MNLIFGFSLTCVQKYPNQTKLIICIILAQKFSNRREDIVAMQIEGRLDGVYSGLRR